MMPACLSVAVFFLCVCVGYTRWYDWKLNEYTLKGLILLLVGIISYVFFGNIAFNRHREKIHSLEILNYRIHICLGIKMIFLFIGILAVIFFYKYILFVTNCFGKPVMGISQRLYLYRYLSVNKELVGEYAIPKGVLLLKYLAEVNAILSIYIISFNRIMAGIRKDIVLFVPILLSVTVSFLNSSRGELITLTCFVIYIHYFLYRMKYGIRIAGKKILKEGVAIFIFFIIAFLALAILLGKRNSFSFYDIVQYISVYISGGIRGFDIFVNLDYPHNMGVVGNDETLHYISVFLGKYLNIGNYNETQLEFSYINGKSIGNLYTAFRRYYSDYGCPGLIVFSGIIGYIYCWMYAVCCNRVDEKKVSCIVLVFAYLSRTIFYLPIEDYFYISICTINGIFKLLCIIVLFHFVIKKSLLKNNV